MEAPSGGATPKSRHVQHGARKSGGEGGGGIPTSSPPAGVVVCPTDPSQPRLWEGRAKAVFPSVNIRTPLPSPCTRQICMTTKETRRERTGNRVSLETDPENNATMILSSRF